MRVAVTPPGAVAIALDCGVKLISSAWLEVVIPGWRTVYGPLPCTTEITLFARLGAVAAVTPSWSSTAGVLPWQ